MTNFNNTLDFLDWAFVALLKRTPSPQESQHLEAAIETQSMTQLQVLALIIDGQEYRNSNIDNEFVPSGHFYSAVPSLADRRRVLDSPTQSAPPPGIDLNHTTQVQLLKSFEQYYDDNLFAVEKCSERRYYSNNPAFSWHDAFVLHAMIKSFKPRSIIEIGCGFSSGVTLDCIEDIDNYTPEVVFIEPFPETLNSVLYPQDSILCGLIDTPAQEVAFEKFTALKANDVLFIDSTHVSKLGSDVNHLFFEILPRLDSGVLVHIHDIFYPFEYPRDWIDQGRAWNELYLVRALLAATERYKIIAFNHYLAATEKSYLNQAMPRLAEGNCGSLWLRIN